MEIRLANVKYSENLGDGLLCECLERVLSASSIDVTGCQSIDLAARSGYSSPRLHRAFLLSLLAALPLWLRNLMLFIPLNVVSRLKWRPHYVKGLDRCDLLVLGGGNLFIDIDLNFPIKISSIITLASRKNIPIAIYGVGVGRRWSKVGVWMVNRALRKANILYISVRDEASRVSFAKHFGQCGYIAPDVVLDPGFTVPSVYNVGASGSANKRLVGVNICSAEAIRYHSPEKLSDQWLVDWYANLIHSLSSSGFRVKLFTNGSGDDEGFKGRLGEIIGRSYGNIELVDRPETPEELVGIISTLECVVAFRMHALIAALSLGKSVVALKWDVKVQSIMERLGIEDSFFSVREAPPSLIVERINELTCAEGAQVSADSLVRMAEKDMLSLVSDYPRRLRCGLSRVEGA